DFAFSENLGEELGAVVGQFVLGPDAHHRPLRVVLADAFAGTDATDPCTDDGVVASNHLLRAGLAPSARMRREKSSCANEKPRLARPPAMGYSRDEHDLADHREPDEAIWRYDGAGCPEPRDRAGR